MIKHDDCFAAWAEHALYFADRCGCVGSVMQYAVRVDEIERVVRELEMFGVSDAKRAGKLKYFEAPFCQIDCGVSEIDTRIVRAGFGELSSVSAESATHFQHCEIFCVGKSSSGWNVPLFAIAMLFNEFVKLA